MKEMPNLYNLPNNLPHLLGLGRAAVVSSVEGNFRIWISFDSPSLPSLDSPFSTSVCLSLRNLIWKEKKIENNINKILLEINYKYFLLYRKTWFRHEVVHLKYIIYIPGEKILIIFHRSSNYMIYIVRGFLAVFICFSFYYI